MSGHHSDLESFGSSSHQPRDRCGSAPVRDEDMVLGAVSMETKEEDSRQQPTQKTLEKLASLQSTSLQKLHDMSAFEYKPLNRLPIGPSIRLVTIQPGDRDDLINLELTNTTFAAKPRYEALSYTWGTAKNQVSVRINGNESLVRENLCHALKHFRHKSENRILWIDAICINQGDDGEKSWQVQLMYDIYRRARRVLVWLGNIHQYFSQPRTPSKGRVMDDLERLELCKHAYWTRVWIVQEVIAASDIVIHWEIPAKASFDQISKSESWDRFFEGIPPGSLDNPIDFLVRQRKGRHGNVLLSNLIESCSRCDCVLPHDKIYGFVGIARDCENGIFPVDYSKSLWELYEDTIRFCYNSPYFDGSGSIVHFSELILRSLGNVELPSTFKHTHTVECECNGHVEDGSCLFKINGIKGGQISFLGPTYDELAANPASERKWAITLRGCNTNTTHLRAENDKFLTSILDLEDSQMAGSAAFIDSFPWTQDPLRFYNPLNLSIPSTVGEEEWRPSDYRLFATNRGTIGLAPANVNIGDEIIHFQDTEIVAVLRNEGVLRVVGKALLAKQRHTRQQESGGLNMDETTDFYLDIVTLRKLTEKSAL